MRAVSINPNIFRIASKILKQDDDLLYEAVKYNRQHLRYASIRQLKNRNLIFRACETKYSSSSHYHERSILTMALPVAKNNPGLALEILETDPLSACAAIKHFKNHKEIIVKAIEIAPHLIFKVMKKQGWFPNMKEICLEAVRVDSNIFKGLGPFRYDKDIFKIGIFCCSPPPYTEEMLRDKDFALGLVRAKHNLIYDIDEKLQKDRDIILQLFRVSQLSDKFRTRFLPNLANDKEYLLSAAHYCYTYSVLNFASDELRNDKELILKAFKCSPSRTMEMLPLELRLDREIVERYMDCIYITTFDPSMIPKNLLEEDEFVWKMIEKHANFINKFPNHEFFKDKSKILKMISKGVSCYELISNDLRQDPDIKLALIKIGNYPMKNSLVLISE